MPNDTDRDDHANGNVALSPVVRVASDAAAHPYSTLTPDCVLDAVEQQAEALLAGAICDGRVLALNSYENRVYQVGIEDASPVIAKFYRPARWSEAQIREEHAFTLELAAQEIPVVPPLCDERGETLFTHAGFHFALYPRKGGHAPELDNLDHLLMIGRFIGRIHRVGASKPFVHRPVLSVQDFGHDSVTFVSEHCIPASLKAAYVSVTHELLGRVESAFASQPQVTVLRTHGDCHPGNILWRDDIPQFVDFDDARMAPAIQDLWMLLSGDRAQRTLQLGEIIEGYNEFAEFDPREIALIEPLRRLRMLHYAAWLGRRWDDPAFPLAFPWFNSEAYWGRHILELREQLSILQEPLLKLQP